jgi:MFS family permease
VFAAGFIGRAAAQYPAGWLADRIGRRPLLLGSLIVYALVFPLYVLPVVVIGVAEGGLTAAGLPALNTEASRRAPPGAQGRTRGVFQLGLNVAQVAGAVVTGALYGVGASPAFVGAAAACLLGLAANLVMTARTRT